MRRYHLVSSPWRAGISIGILAGVLCGVLFGSEGPSLAAGLVGGVIGGAAYGVVAGLEARHPLAAVAELSAADRATVMGTVHRGLPATDRRLAPAVVSYAEAVRRRYFEWVGKKGSVAAVRILAGLQMLLVLDNIVDGDLMVAAMTLILGITLLLVPRWVARAAVRLDRAEQSARTMLD